MKACSLDPTELEAWAEEQTGRKPELCPGCQPAERAADLDGARSEGAVHLTRLANNLLNFILEVAAIQLERGSSEYELTIAEAAAELGKSPAQLRQALEQLLAENYVTFAEKSAAGKRRESRSILYPTARAMRCLPAFAHLPAVALQTEIDRLRSTSAAPPVAAPDGVEKTTRLMDSCHEC